MNNVQAKQWMQEQMAQLRTLRDEVRVNLHLAGMEARDRWQTLEPLVEDAERLLEDVSDISSKALDGLVKRVRAFRQDLEDHARP
ncbi:MAG: hypothetical protein L0Y66_02020 [Myxococcaceae bacterium]|nr:hypothetical protein [Myxococcaceae bacterium]MCI0673639.1 hypothetical protein [Myxococcaceae bacterium]